MSESINNSDPNYAGVPLPEVWIQSERLLKAESTEKILNALEGVEKIRQINLKGESLPATINSGPNKGIANDHSERRVIKFCGKEVELKHLVGDFYIELAVDDEEELKAKVKEIEDAVKDVMPFGYSIQIGRYSKYRPSLHDYR
jgi:methyl-coenzyme M reductase subunit D